MVKNQADAEIDQFLWAGLTTSQKESFTYKDWNGNSQWYMVKDQNNNWALNSATGGLDSFKAYQSTNSGDTYINASNPTGAVRVNYESGSGTGFNIYGGGSGTLYASFTAANAIKFPGLASSSGLDCLQVDNSGYVSNTGSACGSGSGSNGTVSSGTSGQIAYYTANGTTIGGMSSVPVTTGGTGASTAAGALASLGAEPMSLTGSGVPSAACSSTVNNGTFYTSSALSLYQCSGATGTYQWNAVSGGGSSGVSSVNLLNGAVNVIAGAGISVTSAGSSITIGNTGSGAPAVYYNVLSYGAKADMLPLSGYIGASLTAGSSSAYVGGGNFTSTDAGKYITLAPSGSWTAPFAATGNSPGNTAQIVSVTNGQTIVLSKSSTVTESAYISWGTDNVPAFNACSTAAAAAGGGTCAIPAGNYLLATSPYYLLNGMAQDSGDYGNPGGGSGAAISCTVAAGSLSGCTVTSGGSLYVPNTTLTLNFPQSGYANSGCPAVYSGACGQEFATVTTNGSGQVQNPVTIVYKGFGLASAPIPTVNATGGDGAAATCALTGGTCGTPSITAGGGGYPASSSNFLEVWAFNAPGGTCAGGQRHRFKQLVRCNQQRHLDHGAYGLRNHPATYCVWRFFLLECEHISFYSAMHEPCPTCSRCDSRAGDARAGCELVWAGRCEPGWRQLTGNMGWDDCRHSYARNHANSARDVGRSNAEYRSTRSYHQRRIYRDLRSVQPEQDKYSGCWIQRRDRNADGGVRSQLAGKQFVVRRLRGVCERWFLGP